MSQADDITRLVAIMVRQHQGGRAETLRYEAFGLQGDAGVGRLAKAAGCSPATLRAWEDGDATPTCQEGLAWLSALYGALPRTLAAQLHRTAEKALPEPA